MKPTFSDISRKQRLKIRGNKVRKSKHTPFDIALVLGNRQRINSAIQELNYALANLKVVESLELKENVRKIMKAVNLLVEYNCKNVENGIS